MLKTMKNTARQPFADTLTDLGRAMDEQRAVVIAYADADEAPSIRTIEIHDIITGGDDGAVFVQSMDRLSQGFRGFRADRIQIYIALDEAYVLDAPTLPLPVRFTARTEKEFVALELERD
ncbi:WYL domain-containing protein [Streptomyces sp. NPDC050523]|uniref:WYL domain-containing protein n=1 Tax=Streptomyces sp. NPDC050523 TaxID=3365622 RepID=UPI00379B7217